MKTITLTELYRRFGPRADVVLSDYLSMLPREKGKQRNYTILASLPSSDHYLKMEATCFERSLAVQLKEAHEELVALEKEIADWYASLPPNFRTTKQGKKIEACKLKMEIVCDLPEASKKIGKYLVFFVPRDPEIMDGRPDKMNNVVRRLQACQDSLRENEVEDVFVQKLEKHINLLRKIKFPSAY